MKLKKKDYYKRVKFVNKYFYLVHEYMKYIDYSEYYLGDIYCSLIFDIKNFHSMNSREKKRIQIYDTIVKVLLNNIDKKIYEYIDNTIYDPEDIAINYIYVNTIVNYICNIKNEKRELKLLNNNYKTFVKHYFLSLFTKNEKIYNEYIKTSGLKKSVINLFLHKLKYKMRHPDVQLYLYNPPYNISLAEALIRKLQIKGKVYGYK